MPWTPKDATRHNKRATGEKARVWSKVANEKLFTSGDEGSAIREANAAVDRIHKQPRKR